MAKFVSWICLTVFVSFANSLAQDTAAKQDPSVTLKDSTLDNSDSIPTPAPIPRTSSETSEEPEDEKSPERARLSAKDWAALGGVLVGLGGLFFGLYQYRKRNRDVKEKKLAELAAEAEHKQKAQFQKAQTAEQRYREALREELGTIKILGSPDIDSLPVDLLDAFVSLDISETWRSESRFDPKKMKREAVQEKHSTPEEVLQRAFKHFRLLLLIGDPGSGKTTLMKFYAMSCLKNDGYQRLGFKEPVLPIYFPLRELQPKDKPPAPLPTNLAQWAKNHVLDISAEEFQAWLHNRPTLVLLDGLDEISDLEQRRRVCKWIDGTCAGLKNARFVVTSRWTGYRKAEGVELEVDHLRADVRDFNSDQQEEFLSKWLRAAFIRDYREPGDPSKEWLERQEKRADVRLNEIVNFLNEEKNKSLRQLTAVPMLLQIMVILWKERDIRPESRSALYDSSLNYLLAYRDQRRQLDPVLPTDKARRVLSPTALWMQETLQRDEAPKQALHDQMQPILNTMDQQPGAQDFCKNLVDRAGLLADYGETDYIFRHKSFREFLAGVQLTRVEDKDERIKNLASHFGEDWWEEPLRFFIGQADDALFDKFIDLFFQSEVSRELDQKSQNLLQTLVREAPQRKITALSRWLKDKRTSDNQRRYILECLKTIGTEDAFGEVEQYLKNNLHEESSVLNYAREIIAAQIVAAPTGETKREFAESIRGRFAESTDLFDELPPSFRNQVEYILIPGGEFPYSLSKKLESVQNSYFAKYPVTNKHFRKFIAYLEELDPALQQTLPLQLFAERLLTFAQTVKDYSEFLGPDPKMWPDKLRSEEENNKRFNQDDQPVVGIAWFAARAYCFWLSCLEQTQWDKRLENAGTLSHIYRLPTELEWEWAAAGREPDGALREYPWAKEKGEPNEKLANYDGTVGATTPVGRYPEGASPEGLMDMAGNVWEWMENWSQTSQKYRALRGGSWVLNSGFLRCSVRSNFVPDGRNDGIGFRVVRPQSQN